MRKSDFPLCENDGADQLCSNCTADQRLRFRFRDSTIALLLKSEILSFYPSVASQTRLCRTWSKAPKTGFLAPRLILVIPEISKVRDASSIKIMANLEENVK